jgi:hypothetical protein
MACRSCGAPPGLGDYVHAALSAVGITPERVSAAMGVNDCGCDERREWLNQVGHAVGIGSPPEGPNLDARRTRPSDGNPAVS